MNGLKKCTRDPFFFFGCHALFPVVSFYVYEKCLRVSSFCADVPRIEGSLRSLLLSKKKKKKKRANKTKQTTTTKKKTEKQNKKSSLTTLTRSFDPMHST